MTQPCRWTRASISKAATAMRSERGFSQPTVRTLNRILSDHRFLLTEDGYSIADVMAQSASEKRKIWTAIKKDLHPPVSKLSLQDLYGYVYSTSHHLGWDWSGKLETLPEKKRVSKRCEASRPADGSSDKVPRLGLPKKRKVDDDDLDVPRELTAHQQHMRTTMARLKQDSPGMSAKERFTEATRLWNLGKKKKLSASQIAQMREAQLERLRNPPKPRDPMEDMFVPAPRRKQPAAAASTGSSAIPRGARLSSQQKQQLASYNPRRRDADKLRRRAQMHMLRGKSFDEAVLLAEGRDASELNPRARPATATPASAIRRTGRNSRRFIDDTASV